MRRGLILVTALIGAQLAVVAGAEADVTPASSAMAPASATVPTFDIVSQVDLQEVRNAVDQADREITTRFDFKDTGSSIELDATGKSIALFKPPCR